MIIWLIQAKRHLHSSPSKQFKSFCFQGKVSHIEDFWFEKQILFVGSLGQGSYQPSEKHLLINSNENLEEPERVRWPLLNTGPGCSRAGRPV